MIKKVKAWLGYGKPVAMKDVIKEQCRPTAPFLRGEVNTPTNKPTNKIDGANLHNPKDTRYATPNDFANQSEAHVSSSYSGGGGTFGGAGSSGSWSSSDSSSDSSSSSD